MSQAGLIPFQDDLGNSAELLSSCATIEEDLKTVLGDKVPEVKDLAIAIDSSIVTLNNCYLDGVIAENSAADAAALVGEFAKDLCEQAQEEVRPLDPADIQPYGRFVRDLLKVRNKTSTQIPTELIQLWVDEYKRAHDNDDSDDDVQAVGESVERPFCPISGSLLEKPVRASSCGHVFSEDSIHHVLRGKMKCPSRGCNHHISRDVLLRDHLMDIRAKLWQEKLSLTREQETLGLEAI